MTESDGHPPPFYRWISEIAAIPGVLASPLRQVVRVEKFGEDRPVLVIPGMLSGDGSTSLLRRSLTEAGFVAQGWKRWWNTGVKVEVLDELQHQLAKLRASSGKRALIIGWSLGGLYARVLANRCPDDVTLVVTLASPFSGDRRANNAWRLYELLNDHPVNDPPIPDDPAKKPPVRTIAVWSAIDGIVSPESARGKPDERDEAFEIDCRHFEFGCSPAAVRTILRLLQRELDHNG